MNRQILTLGLWLSVPTSAIGNTPNISLQLEDHQLLLDGGMVDSLGAAEIIEPITSLKEDYTYLPDRSGDVNKAQFSQFHSGEQAYVGVDGANLRSLKDKEMILAKLPLASKITIMGVFGEPTVETQRKNVWYHIKLRDGREGLLFGAILTPYAGIFMGNYAGDNDMDDNGNFIGQKWAVTFASDGKPRLRIEESKTSKDILAFDLIPTEQFIGGKLTAQTQSYDSNGYEFSEEILIELCRVDQNQKPLCSIAKVRDNDDNGISQVTPPDPWQYSPTGNLTPECGKAETIDFKPSALTEPQFQLDLGTMDFYANKNIDCYMVGTIKSGIYNRKKLLSCTRTVNDKSGVDRESIHIGRYVQDKDTLIYLPCASKDWDAVLISDRMVEQKMKNSVDASITEISGLAIPEELPVERGKLFYVAHLAPIDTTTELLFTDPIVGAVYASDGEILAVQPDNSTLKYMWSPTDERNPILFGQSYLQYGFGCSDLPFKLTLEPRVSKEDLETILLLPNGIEIGKLKDSNHQVNQQNLVSVKTPLSAEDFLAQNPWVFVEDPWGRMIQLMRKELQSPAMCEPIIYVYADHPTPVSIAPIEPLQFFKTIPPGPQGWKGVAHSDGSVSINGKRWPELFWEGRSFDFDMPEDSVVVGEQEIERYLREMLLAQGLQDHEIEAFLDAWLPDLLGRGSFRMAFHSFDSIEEIAPLDITPTPEMIIRVMLDAAPTNELPNWNGLVPQYERSERKGMVVVEWGGILRD